MLDQHRLLQRLGYLQELLHPQEDPDEQELRRDEIARAIEDAVQELGDQHAAEAWSTPDDQTMLDLDVDETGIWIRADFGDSTAVNGDLVPPNKTPVPPAGFTKTHLGGDIPTTEEEVDTRAAVDLVVRKNEFDEDEVYAVATERFKKPQSYVTTSGEAEIWVKKPDAQTET